MTHAAQDAAPSPADVNTGVDAEPRRRRARRRMLVGLAALAPVVVAPALAEARAQVNVARSLARCEARPPGDERCVGVGGVGLDVRGLHLRDVRAHWRGRDVAAKTVDVQLGERGLSITADGLAARVPLHAQRAASSRPDPSRPASAPPTTPGWTEEFGARVRRQLEDTPIRFTARGEVVVPVGERTLRLTDPSLSRAADGSLAGNFDLGLWRGDERLATARDVELTSATGSESPDHVAHGLSAELAGVVALKGGEEVGLRGTVRRDAIDLQLATRRGGQAWARVPDWLNPQRIDLRFEELDLGPLAPLRGGLGRKIDVGLDEAAVTGHLTAALERESDGSDTLALSFDALELSGLSLHSRQLAREPLRLQTTRLDGQVRLGRAADRVSGDLDLAHGAMKAHLAGAADHERLELDAGFERMSCQSLLGAMPRGLVPMLEGTRLSGELGGHVHLAFAWADVDHAAALEAETGEQQPAPGTLGFDFPFLEDCDIVRDAPGVDLDALDGPYRHHFLSDGGRELTRVFDAVDPNWVDLGEVPTLARAFVTLEDTRFWSHDGFDREQIVRAFWHDLSASRFSRGASTISQQTARNLWLGMDRSIGRKMQEAVYTARIEASLGKRRILEIYLNIIELGPEIHGVREAARFHFGREPDELNLREAVHLASLAPGPVLYSNRFERGEVDDEWRAHLDTQIERMRIHGLISAETAAAARRAPLRLVDRSRAPGE